MAGKIEQPDPNLIRANYEVAAEGEIQLQNQRKINALTQTDGILTLDQINLLPLSKNIKFNYDAGDPILPRGGFSDLKNVARALRGGNPWLASSYMARITENMMEIWKVQKEISLTEAAASISSMELVMVLAEELGEIIMNKAEKEAEMYKALGIAACVALTISLVGLGLSIGGNTIASRSKSIRDKANADTPDGAPSSESPNVASNKPLPASKSVNADLNAPDAPEPMPSSSSINAPTKKSSVDANTNVNQASIPKGSPRSSATSDTVDVDAALPDNSATISKSKPSATTGRDEGRVRSSQEAEMQGKKSDGTPPDRARSLQDADRLDGHAGRLSMGGKWMMEYTSVMERAVENFIQAGFKPEIAKYDRDMERIRAAQQIVKQAMESAASERTAAQQVLQSALDLLQKIADENTRAFNVTHG